MILKNSFLTDVKENIRQRNWVFWISFLTLFCYFPGYLIISLNNLRALYEGADSAGMEQMEKRMTATVESLFGLNGFGLFFVFCLALFIGMQGFAYLHHKRQVDFYHSQPVSRKRRFLVFWTNGIFIFLAAYVSNMVAGMLVAATYGKLSTALIQTAWEASGLYLLFYLGIYHLAIMAVLLTGNTLVSFLVVSALLGYELAIRAMGFVMASSFFWTFGDEESKILNTVLSPMVVIMEYLLMGEQQYGNTYYAGETYTYWGTVFSLLLLAVLFGVMNFFLYGRRASESHGSSISFPKMKEVLRFALLLLTGSFGGYTVYYLAGESVGLGIAGAVFVVGLGHAVIQLIYEVDFRAIGKKRITALVSLAVVICIFLGFKYDWLGYDKRIPEKSQVKSIYLSLAAEGFGHHNYVMLDGTEIYLQSQKKRQMELTDLDKIYELLEKREMTRQISREWEETYEPLEVIFRLKNGKTQSRNLYLNYEEHLEVLDEIYHMEEYLLANCQVLEENFVDNYRIISAGYHNGMVSQDLEGVDMKVLVEAYKKDLENGSYREVYEKLPVGQLTLYGTGLKKKEYRNAWNLIIYDSYKNTLEILDKSGIQGKAVFGQEDLKKVQKIEVRYTAYETSGTMTKSLGEKTVIYKKKDQLEDILKTAVPESNRFWTPYRNVLSEEISVVVYSASPYGHDNYEISEVYFQTGDLPEFILKDLDTVSLGEEKEIE